MLGGVPVSVNKPPVLEPNATGINNFEGRLPALHAAVTVTGNKAATVPVLLTNPESKLDPVVTITKSLGTLFLAHFTKYRPATAVHPVLASPSPIMKSAAIIITVVLLNPLRVSLMSKIPKRNNEIMDIKATTSGGNFPQMNKRIVILSITSSVNIAEDEIKSVQSQYRNL